MKKFSSLRIFILFSIFPVLLTTFLTACQSPKSEEVYRETRFLFDTEVYIEVYGPGAEQNGMKALKKMAAIDRAANRYSKDSEISKLNQAAGKMPVVLSKDTFDLLQESLKIADLTNGIFDPAIGPFVQLWLKAKSDKVLPSSEEIQKYLPLIHYKKVRLDPANKTAFLPESGMSIDLGAIAKGFAVEQAMSILKKAGITSAMVRAGGNIYTIGTKPDGSSWKIGIRDPHKLDSTIGYLEPLNQVVDTSGMYEQFFTVAGKKYGHIIDPRTGLPAEKTASCTIITDHPALADALSTAVFILGKEKGLALMKEFPRTEGIVIGTDGSRAMSPGFKKGLHPNKQ